MAELKTKPNDSSVIDFLSSIEDEQKRADSFHIIEMMKQAAKAEPKMWGNAIIGFGEYHYKYASGREGDWFLVGFSPRKQNFSIYLMSCENEKNFSDLFAKLGKHKTGKSCLYFKRLADINCTVLENLIQKSVDELKEYKK